MAARNLIGTVTVWLEETAPIGHLKFRLEIVRSPLQRDVADVRIRPAGDSARVYRTAFASYAAEDRVEVLKRVQLLPKLGIRVFQDFLTLDPGERWARAVYRSIDTTDVFLLFWSAPAKRSRWVLRETRYALRRKGGDDLSPPEIIPVPIEGPPPVPPLGDLRHLVGSVVGEVSQLAERARPLIEAGDGRSALAILEAVTEEYVARWADLDDSDGEASGLFEELAPLWTEAILVADLTPAERRAWAKRLGAWQDEVAEYGAETAFEVAQAAAQQGWDAPGVRRVLGGEISSTGVWEGEAPWFADDLAVARLNILERQGRFQEALYLAEAEGQTDRSLPGAAGRARPRAGGGHL
jgi:hypothetical protein